MTGCSYDHAPSPSLPIKARISSAFQAVVLSPSFTGFGYFPDLTPLRNEVRPIGISGGVFVFGLPTICQILKNPVSGRWVVVIAMRCTSWVVVEHWLYFSVISGNCISCFKCNFKKVFSLTCSTHRGLFHRNNYD